MVKEYKRVKEPSSIGSSYNPNLVNRLNDYSKLIGVDRTKIVSSLINEALEGRILTNDFIELDQPYYFDFNKLVHEGTVEATIEKPVINPERLYILKKIPNNLDKPNKEYGTYSFSKENPNLHKGIYYYSLLYIEESDIDNIEEIIEGAIYILDNAVFYDFYFLFEYEQESDKIIIHSIKEENLTYEVDPLVYPEVIEDIKQQEDNFTKNLILPNGNVNIFQALNFTDVMISYKLYKDTEFDLATDTDEKAKTTYLKGFSEFNDFFNK